MSDNQVVAIDIRNVFKRYGDFTALERISMSIYDNEFFTLLGPSGCGKTTLLRMIAGFEGVTQGEITLFGSEIENLPPNKRPVNTVFQNYALFPHMSVIDNVGFGLEMRGSPKQQARQRAGQMLELVQLSSFSHRMPAQLSGGQQQRVALARALAPQPKVLLLDEPLSALDLKLRQAMRFELKEIQRETGITFIFVTHDQQEALTMSDRIAVMSAGRLQQLGDARNIYERPRNRFVADFIGDSNLLEVTVDRIEGGWALCHLGDGRTLSCESVEGLVAGSKAFMSVRPERLSLSGEPVEGASLKGLIRSNIFGGTEILTIVELDVGPQVTVRTANSDRDKERILEPGTRIYVNMEGGAGRLLAD